MTAGIYYILSYSFFYIQSNLERRKNTIKSVVTFAKFSIVLQCTKLCSHRSHFQTTSFLSSITNSLDQREPIVHVTSHEIAACVNSCCGTICTITIVLQNFNGQNQVISIGIHKVYKKAKHFSCRFRNR